MRFSRIHLDSNIFIRAFEADPDDEIARGLLDVFGLADRQSPQAFVTSQITLAETLVDPVRSGNHARQIQYKALLSASGNWLEVVPVWRTILVSAAELRGKTRLKLPDAIHAATSIASGCSHIFTADRDFGDHALGLNETSLRAIATWLRAP